MKKIIIVITVLILLFPTILMIGCGNKKLKQAKKQEWITVETYNDETAKAYYQPIWYTREVYDETFIFVGEEGSAQLLYVPAEIKYVRDYQLQATYTEGVDYKIEGKTITRLKGSSMPYWEIDDYFVTEDKAPLLIPAAMHTLEFEFDDNRYIYYAEGVDITKNNISISYTTDDKWKGEMIEGQTDKTKKFLDKLKTEGKGSIMFYGDSITTGCNASGTTQGGNINPYTPSFDKLVVNWLEDKYNANITLYNEAVGGWTTGNGVEGLESKILSKATDIDMFVVAFGMNDMNTSLNNYNYLINKMATRYLEINPNGVVVLVSTMLPNTQSGWVGNQRYFEEELIKIADKNDSIAVARVNYVFTQYEEMGKRTRDYLANNINHPNDFGVRTYAQVILKTIAGDDFFKERY